MDQDKNLLTVSWENKINFVLFPGLFCNFVYCGDIISLFIKMAFNDNLGDSFNNVPLFCNDESVYTIKHVFLVKSECRMRFYRQNILLTEIFSKNKVVIFRNELLLLNGQSHRQNRKQKSA